MAIWYGFHRKTLWVIFEDSQKQCISPFSLEDCLQLFGLCFESSVHLPCYSDVSSEHPLTITLERTMSAAQSLKLYGGLNFEVQYSSSL